MKVKRDRKSFQKKKHGVRLWTRMATCLKTTTEVLERSWGIVQQHMPRPSEEYLTWAQGDKIKCKKNVTIKSPTDGVIIIQ